MKKSKLGMIVAVALAGLGIGACTTTPPSPIAFNYQVDNGQANRIVQVFDLSGNTVVQIRNLDPKTTHFYNAQNTEIPHKIMGENVVLNGLQSSFTVSSTHAASRVVRTSPLPVAVVPSASAGQINGAAPALRPVSADAVPDEKLLAEIARIKGEIAELKRKIAASESPAVSPLLTVAQPPQPAPAEPAPQAEVVRVTFKDNSQHFQPPREIRARLVEMARQASTVEVRGFTDSVQPSATSEALAKGRADAAKRFLVRRGVDGRKIRVEYESAGKFATDNSTVEGRAANRRVEIRTS
jgi:outer membrane protein OmpA-like peptidoglycan-associated protein